MPYKDPLKAKMVKHNWWRLYTYKKHNPVSKDEYEWFLKCKNCNYCYTELKEKFIYRNLALEVLCERCITNPRSFF